MAERAFGDGRATRSFAALDAMNVAHPTKPHYYLPLLGVDPARQARGDGSGLLASRLRHCDAQGLPACLEATSPRNLPLYRRSPPGCFHVLLERPGPHGGARAGVHRRPARTGLLSLGDAVASFNPIYEQGMSVAALEALALHHTIADHRLQASSTILLLRA